MVNIKSFLKFINYYINNIYNTNNNIFNINYNKNKNNYNINSWVWTPNSLALGLDACPSILGPGGAVKPKGFGFNTNNNIRYLVKDWQKNKI
jgi:hypothetical protein